MLPDLALLEIFDFYLGKMGQMSAWHTLVHVCRKWRGIVFGCPRRLNLHLLCHPGTPVRKTLNVWPVLPISIRDYIEKMWVDAGDIVAALEHNNRIVELALGQHENYSSSQMEEILVAMQQPFPALRRLQLQFKPETTSAIPASFLGGSARHLREIRLERILFPGLPKPLLSATHLVGLELLDIPHSGYISPEVMVTCLSVLTKLKRFCIRFESPRSRPGLKTRRPPPPTRTLLPALTKLVFKGVAEYLEDLVARIDAPLLDNLKITFFHQLIFDTPRLTQFISRTPIFKTHGRNKAHMLCSNMGISFSLLDDSKSDLLAQIYFDLTISCRRLDWQLSCMARAINSSFPHALIPAVEHLHIFEIFWDGILHGQDDIENSQWLELLHPFTGVKDLYMPSGLTRHIAPALQELVGERLTEVLPALQTVFLEKLSDGPVPEAIGQFVAARRLANHPVAVSRWEDKGTSGCMLPSAILLYRHCFS
jgi:hypothetical protein